MCLAFDIGAAIGEPGAASESVCAANPRQMEFRQMKPGQEIVSQKCLFCISANEAWPINSFHKKV